MNLMTLRAAYLLTALLFASAVPSGHAQSLAFTPHSAVWLVETDVVTFDPSTFTPGPNIDVYYLVLINQNQVGITSLEIDLCFSSGTLLNFSRKPLAFKNDPALPTLGPNIVAESFFLIPPSSSEVLAAGTIDTDNRLSSTFSLPGNMPLIPADSSAVVAVLSVPTGDSPNILRNPFGRAEIGGEFVDVLRSLEDQPYDRCVPEPSGTLLGLLAILGAFHSRRRCVA